MPDGEIRTHGEYLEYINQCHGEAQYTNAYRILSFLKYGNENAIEMVSNNPHASLTAYLFMPITKRWAGIITGDDKILLVADNDIINEYKDKIEQQSLKIANLSLNRGAMVIMTTMDGGLVDEKGHLLLDMEFVSDFGEYCLSENTPPKGSIQIGRAHV